MICVSKKMFCIGRMKVKKVKLVLAACCFDFPNIMQQMCITIDSQSNIEMKPQQFDVTHGVNFFMISCFYEVIFLKK